VEAILPHLHEVDLVLLMSVFPGYSGQKYIPESTARAAQLHEYITRNNLPCLLEVDGGVGRDTAPELLTAGADVFVMGSAFFGDPDPAKLIRDIRAIPVG